MALTLEQIDERIEQLQEGLGSESEVSFEGESTKYRSISEIKKAIGYYTKLKNSLADKPRSRYRSMNFRVDRRL